MEPAVAPPSRLLVLRPLAALLALAGVPFAGHAADAHRAVDARPGDIVLLRGVSARPAARPAPPGMALMVSPSPQPEIVASLGGELSDDDIAQLGATPSPTAQLPSAVGRALDAMLVRGSGGTTVAGNGLGSAVAAPTGAVGNATAGIGDQVQGALAQLPFGNGH